MPQNCLSSGNQQAISESWGWSNAGWCYWQRPARPPLKSSADLAIPLGSQRVVVGRGSWNTWSSVTGESKNSIFSFEDTFISNLYPYLGVEGIVGDLPLPNYVWRNYFSFKNTSSRMKWKWNSCWACSGNGAVWNAGSWRRWPHFWGLKLNSGSTLHSQ